MSVLNLLWAFDFVSTEKAPRDPQCPIRFDDFAPVSHPLVILLPSKPSMSFI